MDNNQSQRASNVVAGLSTEPRGGGVGDPRRTGRGKRILRIAARICVWVLPALAAAAIAVLQCTDVMADNAKANIGTLIAAFVAAVTLISWFAFFSPFPARVRMLPLVGSLAFCGVFAALFRIEHVSGELVPRFAWRFSRSPDELLDKPELPDPTADQTPTADLSTTTKDDFPQFLGPDRSASIDRVELARDWDASPPKLVWRQKIGAGWSGFSVVNGYAVTMEQRGELEMVTCYDVLTGRLRWFHSIPVRYQSRLAGIGPRATPTIDQGMVYTLGATGQLLCLNGATGQCPWGKDLWKEYGVTEEDEEAEVPYGRANSPLIVEDLVIIPAGGPAHSAGQRSARVSGPRRKGHVRGRETLAQPVGWVSLAAYDKKTGEKVWEGGNRQISYSSPVLATLGGVEQILIVNQDYVSGHDLHNGNVLWECPWPGKSHSDASVSQAVPVPPDRVFLSKGYSRGAALVQLLPKPVVAGHTVVAGLPTEPPGAGSETRPQQRFDTKQLWHSTRVMRTKFTNVAIWKGHVYGLSDGILECIDLDSGERIWKSGRYGHGQILRVGDLLVVISEGGELFLVEATPDRPNNVLGQREAIDGKTWNTLALYGPYLLVRNAQQAACYELPLEKP